MGGRGQKKVLSANSRYAISKPGAPRVVSASSSSSVSSTVEKVGADSASASVTGIVSDVPTGTSVEGSTATHSSSMKNVLHPEQEISIAGISSTNDSIGNVPSESIDSQVCIDNNSNEINFDEKEKEKGGWTVCD
jgi:hypothetical protein